MKYLILIRHAKSDWNVSVDSDLERPLNKRGLRDAPFMAKLLQSKIKDIDAIFSSPAERTMLTANFFAEAFGKSSEDIIQSENLYLSSYNILLYFIKEIDDSLQKVIIVTHNPGITELSNYLCDKYIDNIPTCGIVGLKLLENNWNSIGRKKCKLDFFEYPKKYFKL